MLAADRRRAVVEAAVPLIAHHGEAVTIQQIAAAAGVATATAFRVFGGKAALLGAVVDHVLDPTDLDRHLVAVGRLGSVEERLRAVGDAVGSHLATVLPVISALDQGSNAEPQQRFAASMERLIGRLAGVVGEADDAARLRHPASLVARVYVGLHLAEGYGRRRHAATDRLPLDEVTEMFLHGALGPVRVD